MRFRAEPSRHQDCRTVFASFARLNHSGPITFYAEMDMFAEPSRRVLQEQSSTPKSTQVRAVPERGNQGQTQHKGTAAGTAYAALVARRLSRRGLMILPLLFLQKQSLAFAVYLFGIGTLHTGPGLKKKAHVIMLSP